MLYVAVIVLPVGAAAGEGDIVGQTVFIKMVVNEFTGGCQSLSFKIRKREISLYFLESFKDERFWLCF